MLSIEFSKLQVNCSSSILESLRVMDEGGAQIILVVDDNDKLVGTVTDGDIRRGLIKGINLISAVTEVMKKDFKYAMEEDKSGAERTMKENLITRLPILNQKGQVVELLANGDQETQLSYPNAVVIMAGGRGKRLLPYTKDCPKPMLLVDGKPILEILIDQCKEYGFINIYISVNYLKEKIINHFKDGSKWGVKINYLIEDEPLGTAGSLKMLPRTLNEPFLVINGDVLTKIELQHILSFHNEHKAEATICVRDHEISVPFGVVETDGAMLSAFAEKPIYKYLVNAGVYVINPSILKIIEEGEDTDMPNLLQRARNLEKTICVCPIHEYWIDVGMPETMKEAENTWSNNER